jgi:hypothetical protein
VKASSIVYWAPKDGSTDAEYEDAWLVVPGPTDEMEGDWVGVAVADGATESLLARQWASLLVEEFAKAPTASLSRRSFAEIALAVADRWPGVVGSYIRGREEQGRAVAWYERPGLIKGAFATILALHMDFRIEPPTGRDKGMDLIDLPVVGRWSSAALGDTCLFHVRGGRVKLAFPVDASVDFSTSPPLLGSADPDPQLIMDRLRLAEGLIVEGDDFYICTDALAAWFLASMERGSYPWETLRDLEEIDFIDWLSHRRRSGEIRNDDVTLIHIDIW